MARTVDQIQADLDRMRGQLGQPYRELRFQDRQLTVSDPAHMRDAIAALQIELDSAIAAQNGSTRERQIRLIPSSGF